MAFGAYRERGSEENARSIAGGGFGTRFCRLAQEGAVSLTATRLRLAEFSSPQPHIMP